MNPKEIPLNSSDCYFYGVSKFSKICELFGFKQQKVCITESFQDLLTKLSEKNHFIRIAVDFLKNSGVLNYQMKVLPGLFKQNTLSDKFYHCLLALQNVKEALV